MDISMSLHKCIGTSLYHESMEDHCWLLKIYI